MQCVVENQGGNVNVFLIYSSRCWERSLPCVRSFFFLPPSADFLCCPELQKKNTFIFKTQKKNRAKSLKLTRKSDVFEIEQKVEEVQKIDFESGEGLWKGVTHSNRDFKGVLELFLSKKGLEGVWWKKQKNKIKNKK